jgi:hypothetical protein
MFLGLRSRKNKEIMMPVDWTPILKKKILEESILNNTYGGYNGRGLSPTNTQIRNYTPDPAQVGDFGSITDPDTLRYLYFLKNKTTRL